MIRAERITVGEETVDIAQGSRASAVSIQWLLNAGDRPLYFGDGERAMPLAPGATLPGLNLGPTDRLEVFRRRRPDEDEGTDVSGPVDVIVSWG